jgi:hypothetical protein
MHRLIIKQYNRATKEIISEHEETFYSIHNAERRMREIEDRNLDIGTQVKRFAGKLIRNPRQKKIKIKENT